MRLDLNLYTVALPAAERFSERPHYQEDTSRLANDLTASTGIPILASYIMVGKYIGYSEELVSSILNLQKFYKYDSFGGLDPYGSLPNFPQQIWELNK